MPTAGDHFILDPTASPPLPAELRPHRGTTYGVIDRREGNRVYFTLRSVKPTAVSGALLRGKAADPETVGVLHGKIDLERFGIWFVLGRNLPADLRSWAPYRKVDPVVLQGVRQESLGVPYWSHSSSSMYLEFPSEAVFVAY